MNQGAHMAPIVGGISNIASSFLLWKDAIVDDVRAEYGLTNDTQLIILPNSRRHFV